MVEEVEDIFCELRFFWWGCLLFCERGVGGEIVGGSKGGGGRCVLGKR
jgi:hypothetical protein